MNLKKSLSLLSILLSFALATGCSSSDSDEDTSTGSSSLSGKKCTENGAIKCKSADKPHLAYMCESGKWHDVDLSDVRDKEADV